MWWREGGGDMMRPIQISVTPGYCTDKLYILMDNGELWRGWQERKNVGMECVWHWEAVPLPAKETP